jgi:hypothetical protein
MKWCWAPDARKLLRHRDNYRPAVDSKRKTARDEQFPASADFRLPQHLHDPIRPDLDGRFHQTPLGSSTSQGHRHHERHGNNDFFLLQSSMDYGPARKLAQSEQGLYEISTTPITTTSRKCKEIEDSRQVKAAQSRTWAYGTYSRRRTRLRWPRRDTKKRVSKPVRAIAAA